MGTRELVEYSCDICKKSESFRTYPYAQSPARLGWYTIEAQGKPSWTETWCVGCMEKVQAHLIEMAKQTEEVTPIDKGKSIEELDKEILKSPTTSDSYVQQILDMQKAIDKVTNLYPQATMGPDLVKDPPSVIGEEAATLEEQIDHLLKIVVREPGKYGNILHALAPTEDKQGRDRCTCGAAYWDNLGLGVHLKKWDMYWKETGPRYINGG